MQPATQSTTSFSAAISYQFMILGGGRNTLEWVADFLRNRWPASPGIGGWNQAEYAELSVLVWGD